MRYELEFSQGYCFSQEVNLAVEQSCCGLHLNNFGNNQTNSKDKIKPNLKEKRNTHQPAT